jgi:hypothetical protein
MSTRNFLRRDLPLILIVLFAVPNILYRFVADDTLKNINTTIGMWSSTISMIAWGLGMVYLFQGEYHNMKMRNTTTQKFLFGVLVGFSLLLIGLAFMYGDLANGKLGLQSAELQWWYTAFYRAQSTSFYGLMFLYLMSASYRMLRFRSLEASVLMLSGIIYIVAHASIFTIYMPWLVPISDWLYSYPNRAATTAAVMAIAFGSILIGVRQLMGRERTAVEVAS